MTLVYLNKKKQNSIVLQMLYSIKNDVKLSKKNYMHGTGIIYLPCFRYDRNSNPNMKYIKINSLFKS